MRNHILESRRAVRGRRPVALAALLALLAVSTAVFAQPAPAPGVVAPAFRADPGVPAFLATRTRAVAAAAPVFVARDLGLAGPVPAADVVLAADPAGMRAAAAARGKTLRARDTTPGVTRAGTVYLNGRYFLASRVKGPRTPRAAETIAAEVTAHELTHVVANETSRRNLPLWFNEGLAVHETARYLRLGAGDAAAADAFERRRLAPAQRGEPVPLDDLDFGRSERRRFYGKQHALHYSASYAAVRAMAERFGERRLGALLLAAGQGVPRKAKIAERRLRWKRAVREALGIDPSELDGLRDAWLAARPGAARRAPPDEDDSADDAPPDADAADPEAPEADARDPDAREPDSPGSDAPGSDAR